jgi:hypothetical protein
MEYTPDDLIKLVGAVAGLERAGQRAFVDFGYGNAVQKWEELKSARKQERENLQKELTRIQTRLQEIDGRTIYAGTKEV